jgi:predicted RNase H-like HicB family nuclease
MNKLSVIVYKEDKHYVAKGVEIEIASQGASAEEAIENLKEAFGLWLKHADAAT